MDSPKISVVIPAYNEEASIGYVLEEIPRDLVQEVIVVDNGSSDETSTVAKSRGAKVILEPRRGYGSACLTGISHLSEGVDVVVFMDGDFSDYPDEIQNLLTTLWGQKADMVIGSRVLGYNQKGSLTFPQKFGNRLSTRLIKLLFGHTYTDLGPFRAIRTEALKRLRMQDRTFGWTVEMQVKALQHGLRVAEVPVSYRKRIGKSKISGTVLGTFRAGLKILWTIGKLALQKTTDRP
jgi:glycosyltransferase involved in cell wall biosynthesis